MNYSDLIYIISIILLIIVAVYLLTRVSVKEKYMDTINKANKDMSDLEKITSRIEEEYKPINVELTSYEQEQEDNAIISYDELLSNRDKNNNSGFSYDSKYKSDNDLSVKKIDLDNNVSSQEKEEIPEEKVKVKLFNYEKEEAFLRTLKQLQSELS